MNIIFVSGKMAKAKSLSVAQTVLLLVGLLLVPVMLTLLFLTPKNSIKEQGVHHLLRIPFTKEFSQLTAEEYVNDFIWKKFHPRIVVLGFNHRFGNNRTGDINLMTSMGKKIGFEVEEIEAQMVENISVSSTKIRNALMAGDVETANSLLGHHYTLTGKVVAGEQVGRKIGFPTANLKIADADVVAALQRIRDREHRLRQASRATGGNRSVRPRRPGA